MIIWILQDRLRSGGTERQTVLLARAFHAAGHRVEVVTFRPGGALAGTLAPLPHTHLQPFDTKLNWFAPGLVRALRKASPQVVLCMGRMANCHAGRVQRTLPGATVIATMRTGKPLPWLFRRSLRQVAHTVANSDESAGALTRTYGVPADRISIIHNALVFPAVTATSGSGPKDAALRARHGAGPGTTVLVCVGMFRPEKNQRALLEIAARLPRDRDWQLWLAGDGPTRTACEALAGQLGLGDHVRFTGFLADPTPLYRAADLAVLASQSESLSNFLIEAQAHGLPAIAFAAGGVRECIQDNVTGAVVAPGDTAGFLGALQPYLDDPELRARASLAARAFARTAFDPARQARAYLDLFERLAPPR